MQSVINAKTLRTHLERILRRVSKGQKFTVLYRSRPVCQLVPLTSDALSAGKLKEDPLFQGARTVQRRKVGFRS